MKINCQAPVWQWTDNVRIPALLVCLTLPPFSVMAGESELPQTYTASYQASYSGFTATAYRELKQLQDNRFDLEQSLALRVLGAQLGAVEEVSRFDWLNEQPVPLFYDYQQTGISSREISVEFDWPAGNAISREDDESWQLAISPGVMDRLSFQLALRQRLRTQQSGDIALSMVDGDEVEHHVYRIGETEVIETGLGRLETVKVERVREADSNRRTIFWLAVDWDYLLVRLLQTRGSREETELLLQDANLNGQPVIGLP